MTFMIDLKQPGILYFQIELCFFLNENYCHKILEKKINLYDVKNKLFDPAVIHVLCCLDFERTNDFTLI